MVLCPPYLFLKATGYDGGWCRGVWACVGIDEVVSIQPVVDSELLGDPQDEMNGRYEVLYLFDVVRLPASPGAPCLKNRTDHSRTSKGDENS